MSGLLSRIPLKMLKPFAAGLAYVAMMAVAFGAIAVGASSEVEDTTTSGHLWWKKTTENVHADTERLTGVLVGIGLLAVAVLCAGLALKLITMQGGLKKYPPILVGVESMRIQKIADITGARTAKVYRDLESLINSGTIKDFYIDYESEQVFSTRYIPKRSHKTVVTCSGCGGNNELIVGITKHCSFCGEPLVLNAR